MKAELISIGDEILIGQIVNTNSVFLAKQLNGIGLEIVQITAISDKKSIIINAKGIAQEPGQLGQKIWVNNFNSGKKVLCRIKNDKKVTTTAKVY